MTAGDVILILQPNINKGEPVEEMRKTVLIASLLFILFSPLLSGVAFSEDDWHKEFEYICSRVEVGESLKLEELRALSERADALLKRLEDIQERSKKVYIFRLKKCKAFFEYLIELKTSPDRPSP
jgi:hypothetical protein